MPDKWTLGLKDLDARQTRQRLHALIEECRFVAVGLEMLQGQGLRDQIAITESELLRTAKAEIDRLAGKLAEYRSGPLPAPEPAPYCAHRAAAERYRAREAAEAAAAAETDAAPEPEPVAETAPPAARPVPPVRGMRLPPLAPRRSS